MFGSINIYFRQSPEALIKGKKEVMYYLASKGYNDNQIKLYLDAYDYFVVNPTDFDGATLVKDFYDIPGLDLDAMLHDYHYIRYNVATNFKYKKMADKLFLVGMLKKGKNIEASLRRYHALNVS
ncbi:MAG: hypothetical protein RJA53_1956, partial [Bacteroidota bacterium]